MKTAYAIDDQILVTLCALIGQHGIAEISVDDFHDPEEDEITSEEIHLTVVHNGEPLPTCFRLSTTSAQRLIRDLQIAVAKRQREQSAC
jgi:hypothetical protein